MRDLTGGQPRKVNFPSGLVGDYEVIHNYNRQAEIVDVTFDDTPETQAANLANVSFNIPVIEHTLVSFIINCNILLPFTLRYK